MYTVHYKEGGVTNKRLFDSVAKAREFMLEAPYDRHIEYEKEGIDKYEATSEGRSGKLRAEKAAREYEKTTRSYQITVRGNSPEHTTSFNIAGANSVQQAVDRAMLTARRRGLGENCVVTEVKHYD